MLTIKRHFPINRLALSKAWYETKHFFGHAGHSLKTGVASLRARSHSMGKKSILSSLVVLVGFFGSLSALLILYPITTQQGGPLSADSPQANVESQAGSSVTETWMKDGESTTGADGAAQNGQTPSIATSPAPAPVSPSAPASSAPAPVVQSAPVAPQPTIYTTPNAGMTSPTATAPAPAPAPAPVTAPPTSTAPLPTAPAPTDSNQTLLPQVNTAPLAPVTNPTEGGLMTVEGTAGGLLGQ